MIYADVVIQWSDKVEQYTISGRTWMGIFKHVAARHGFSCDEVEAALRQDYSDYGMIVLVAEEPAEGVETPVVVLADKTVAEESPVHHPDCMCNTCYYGADLARWAFNPSEY